MAFRVAARRLAALRSQAPRLAAARKPLAALAVGASGLAVAGVAKSKAEISCQSCCGTVNVSSLTKMAKNDDGLLPQPEKPKFKTALVEIYVPSQQFGGSDKSASGHRYDTIPIANG